jgi:NAD(P)H-dependent FMN reductase
MEKYVGKLSYQQDRRRDITKVFTNDDDNATVNASTAAIVDDSTAMDHITFLTPPYFKSLSFL